MSIRSQWLFLVVRGRDFNTYTELAWQDCIYRRTQITADPITSWVVIDSADLGDSIAHLRRGTHPRSDVVGIAVAHHEKIHTHSDDCGCFRCKKP